MLTLICGRSRAGKTTYSERFDCPVIHLDFVGSMDCVISKVGRMTGDVVVDGIFYDYRKRTALVQAYKGNGTRCIWLDTPREVREERLGYKMRKEHPLPAPSYSEGWDVIVRVRDGVETILDRGVQTWQDTF